MRVTSMDLGLGPDPRILALSEFVLVPGPGVVLVDLDGHGMLYTASVWMDEQGRVTEGGWGSSGTGWSLCDGVVAVTGRADPGSTVVVDVVCPLRDDAVRFEVTTGEDGWYAGCRGLPDTWQGIEHIDMTVHERAEGR
jgi:hypothetical protein